MRIRHWVLGQFDSAERLLEVVRHLRQEGFGELEAYTPMPVEGLAEELKLGRSFLPVFTFLGGLGAAAFVYWVQWYTNAYDLPVNVGNRPPYAPLMNVPLAYEAMILVAAATVFFAFFLVLKLPRLYQPVFEVEAFTSVTRDRYWVSIATHLPNEVEAAAQALRALGASQVATVPEKVHR